jgi:hypothetical protein
MKVITGLELGMEGHLCTDPGKMQPSSSIRGKPDLSAIHVELNADAARPI